MTRYADPHRCPDCRATITPGAATCPTCSLTLQGATAGRLFATLTQADALLATLRAESVPAAVPSTAAGVTTRAAAATPFGAARAKRGSLVPPVTARARRGLSAASVPKLLLGLGAGCLLVAALVFLAVTWSVMGVGGRTATLVALTALTGGLSAWFARRELRAAAEALSLVAYGLLTLDLVGADNAGWFGDTSAGGLLLLVGLVLAAAGTAGALAARRSPLGTLTTPEVALLAGTALAAAGVASGPWLPTSLALVAATLLAAALTVLADHLALRVATVGSAVVAVTAWLAQTGQAHYRVAEHPSWSALWSDLEVWPLLASAGLVGAVALVHRLPHPVRVAAASLAELLLVVAVAAPLLDEGATVTALVGIGALALVGAAAFVLPHRWRLSSAAVQAVAGLGLLALVLDLGSIALERLAEAAVPVWVGSGGDRLLPLSESAHPAPWLLPLAVLAVLGTLWALAEASHHVDRVVAPAADLRVLAAVLAASLVGGLALYPVPVWLVVAGLLLVAATFTAWWLLGGSTVPLIPAAVFGVAALAVSLHAAELTAAALAVTLAATAAVHLRASSVNLSAAAGAVVSAVAAALVWTLGHLAGVAPEQVALAGMVLLGAGALLASYAPERWWAAGSVVWRRSGLEVGAAAGAVPLAMAGLELAPLAEKATWLAVYLTVAGVVVTIMSLLRADRHRLGWAGGALLALASWVRLWDLGVPGPEAYTLPSAAVLLVVGLLHLRRTPEAGTMRALSPALSLALVPSLLWALGGEPGPRALLLGLACLVLVLAGARLGWTAPMTFGASVGALLVLRLAAPYIGDAVPRWVLIGAAGALLIAVGTTWERRLAEARQLRSYVRALR